MSSCAGDGDKNWPVMGEKLDQILKDNPPPPYNSADDFYRELASNFFHGATAAVAAKMIVAPVERSQPTSHMVKGSILAGDLAAVMRAIPTEGLNFTYYDCYKKTFLGGVNFDKEPYMYSARSCVAGAAAGLTSLAFLYPINSAYGIRLGSDFNQMIAMLEARGDRGLSSSTKDLLEEGSRRASDTWQKAKDGASDAAKKVADIGRSSKADPIEAARQQANAAKEAVKNVRESVKDVAREMKGQAMDVRKKVIDGVGEVGKVVKETASDVGHKVREGDVRAVAETFAKKWRTGGAAGLYSGFMSAAACTIVYRMGYFGYYDIGKAYFKPNVDKSGLFFKLWAIAQASVITAGLATHPFDVTRHRFLASSNHYNGSWDCFSSICRNEGFSSLYKGASTNILRSTGGALALVFYDYLKRFAYNMKNM